MPNRVRAFGATLLASACLCACNSTKKCLHLDDLNPSDQFGVGAVIHTSNVDLTVERFQWLGQAWVSTGHVRVDDRRFALGSGTELNANNASIAMAPTYVLDWLSFHFADLGGNENLRINSALANVAHLTSLDGTMLGGVLIQVEWVASGNNHLGRVQLVGPIVDFAIGGQELWIDDLCFRSTDVPATPETWARSYGGPQHDDGKSILATSDGGAVFCGTTGSYPDTRLWLVKLDDEGTVQWQRTYGAAGDLVWRTPLAGAPDGSFLACHYLNGATRVLSLSSLGALEWAREIRFENPSSSNSMSRSADGSTFVAGQVSRSASLGSPSDAFVTRLDPSGAVMWSRRYARNDTYSLVHHGVAATGDGGCIAVGVGHIDFRAWIVKLDALGAIEWQKSGTTPEVILYSVVQTGDGGYLATGRALTYPLPGSSSLDALVMRLDPSGDVSWQKRFDGTHEYGTSAVALSGGGSVIGGLASESWIDAEFWLFEIDEHGDVLWQRRYGGPGNEPCREIAVAADGGYFLAGLTDSFGAGRTDAWVCKVDSHGAIVGPCPSHPTARTGSDFVQPLAAGSVTASELTPTVTPLTITPIDTHATVVQQCPPH